MHDGWSVLDAVRQRLVADVEVASYLSGGIDSSAVLGLAQQEMARPIRAFTLTFENPLYDDAPNASNASPPSAPWNRAAVSPANSTRPSAPPALLKSSFTDSRLDIDVPLARHAISSVGALGFRIGDLSNPKPAKPGDTEVDLTSFAALTTQVDAPVMSDMLNHAPSNGPVSLPEAVAMLDTAYLGRVIVLWSWALKQPDADDPTESTTVRFRCLDGRDREIAVPV